MQMNPAPESQTPAQTRVPIREDLKIALCLGLSGALSVVALFPYLLQQMPQLLAKVPVSIPLPVLIAAQSVQALVLLGVLAFLGLRMGHRNGLDAPWLRALLNKGRLPGLPWPIAVATGVIAALAIIGLDPLFAAYMPATLQALPQATPPVSAWAGFLASFYGGIGEEIQLRLFVMTLLVWSFSFVQKPVHPAMFYMAIVTAALLFGAGHLPAAASIWPLDAVVVARTIVLNSIAGIAFGYLYWKRGLEMAMLAHFSADLVLHVAAPLLG